MYFFPLEIGGGDRGVGTTMLKIGAPLSGNVIIEADRGDPALFSVSLGLLLVGLLECVRLSNASPASLAFFVKGSAYGDRSNRGEIGTATSLEGKLMRKISPLVSPVVYDECVCVCGDMIQVRYNEKKKKGETDRNRDGNSCSIVDIGQLWSSCSSHLL